MSAGITLMDVVNRVRSISNEFYDGKTFENVNGIFNRLSDLEREVLLQSVLEMVIIRNSSIDAPIKDTSGNEKLPIDTENEFDFELYNAIEMMQLRAWIVKISVFAMISFIMLVGIISFFKFEEYETVMELGGEMMAILKIIFR